MNCDSADVFEVWQKQFADKYAAKQAEESAPTEEPSVVGDPCSFEVWRRAFSSTQLGKILSPGAAALNVAVMVQ